MKYSSFFSCCERGGLARWGPGIMRPRATNHVPLFSSWPHAIYVPRGMLILILGKILGARGWHASGKEVGNCCERGSNLIIIGASACARPARPGSHIHFYSHCERHVSVRGFVRCIFTMAWTPMHLMPPAALALSCMLCPGHLFLIAA